MVSLSSSGVAVAAPVTAVVAPSFSSASSSSSSLICTNSSIHEASAKHATVQLLRTVIHMLLLQHQRQFGRSKPDDFDHDIDDHKETKPLEELGLLNYLLQRCRQVDSLLTASSTRTNSGSNHRGIEDTHLERMVLMKGIEMMTNFDDSGYTLLHDAVYQSDICRIFFLLRLDQENHRFTKRPMEILYNYTSSSSTGGSSGSTTNTHNTALQEMISHMDHEGMTPVMLLTRLQRKELNQCRQHLKQIHNQYQQELSSGHPSSQKRRTSRSTSWYDDLRTTEQQNDNAVVDEQNEFDVLSRAMSQYQQVSITRDSSRTPSSPCHSNTTSYGYEVVTFGRAHHCALGVAVSNRHSNHVHYSEERNIPASSITATTDSHSTSSKHASSQFRPQRVMAFAQDTVGRRNTAIAVACSTYHTLTITASGQLLANGLGKGGRLGTGNEKPCATPTLIAGPLLKQFVVAIAAAENHSLCITQQGYVYAFGSNGFGQLGISTNSHHQHSVTGSDSNNSNMNARFLPRRVDDLKHVTCIKVAAGLKHSVALSKDGEVYVWGDNSSGQLGIQGYGNFGGGNSNIHKVTRIDTFWNAKPHPKVAIEIAASDQSTVALISGSGQKGFAVNTIYCWGNGNHIPCKVQFELSSTHIINPIAISCAKYHTVALTSNGHVYSWGLHADPLGTQTNSTAHPRRNRSSSIENDKVKSQYAFTTKATTTSLSAPQLVSGMLPENGGGKVVSIAASENHTAVLTEDGHLWTWGDTYKQNVLGHEGVRWQPEPKRVAGVHRAVAVAAAKEHTVLLIGTSFPPIEKIDGVSSSSFPTLESLAARTIAQHCDLFNVIPILTIAERTQTKELLQYCRKFVRLNLDGVLNVGQKSAMDSYLNEQLLGSALERSNLQYHDETVHPLVADVILAGSDDHESFIKDRLCNVDRWIQACVDLSRQPLVQAQVNRIQRAIDRDTLNRAKQEQIHVLQKPTNTKVRGSSFSEEKYEELTTNMDISTIELAETKLICLTKEVRAIRKRLAHISKLENGQDNLIHLTNEQKQKVARRYQLEASLKKIDPAVEIVEEKLRSLRLEENHIRMMKDEPEIEVTGDSDENCDGDNQDSSKLVSMDTKKEILRCEVCAITCPDGKSFELHMNGRKHRNRMEQVDNDETKQAAASIVEEHNKQLLIQSQDAPKRDKICAWGQTTKAVVKPKYTLPPPPHPMTDTLVTQSRSSHITLSLQDIIADEEKKAKHKQGARKAMPVLKLPAGCPATFQSPPWETAAKLQAMQSPTKIGHAVKSALNVKSSSSPAHAATAVATPKSTFSLADFIPPPAPTPQKVTKSKPIVAWTTPKKDLVPSLSLKEIQVQEQDFKLKQDQTFGTPNSNNKWFIEQRERAGSFKEIQGETAKEMEQRLLIEEQKRIEKQIYDDIAAASAAAVNVQKTKKKIADDRKSSQQKRSHRKPSQKPVTDKKSIQQT